jgi:hypothetical protein
VYGTRGPVTSAELPLHSVWCESNAATLGVESSAFIDGHDGAELEDRAEGIAGFDQPMCAQRGGASIQHKHALQHHVDDDDRVAARKDATGELILERPRPLPRELLRGAGCKVVKHQGAILHVRHERAAVTQFQQHPGLRQRLFVLAGGRLERHGRHRLRSEQRLHARRRFRGDGGQREQQRAHDWPWGGGRRAKRLAQHPTLRRDG